MNLKQAAEIMGVSEGTVIRRYRAGLLPLAHKTGATKPARLIFNRADVERLRDNPPPRKQPDPVLPAMVVAEAAPAYHADPDGAAHPPARKPRTRTP